MVGIISSWAYCHWRGKEVIVSYSHTATPLDGLLHSFPRKDTFNTVFYSAADYLIFKIIFSQLDTFSHKSVPSSQMLQILWGCLEYRKGSWSA